MRNKKDVIKETTCTGKDRTKIYIDKYYKCQSRTMAQKIMSCRSSGREFIRSKCRSKGTRAKEQAAEEKRREAKKRASKNPLKCTYNSGGTDSFCTCASGFAFSVKNNKCVKQTPVLPIKKQCSQITGACKYTCSAGRHWRGKGLGCQSSETVKMLENEKRMECDLKYGRMNSDGRCIVTNDPRHPLAARLYDVSNNVVTGTVANQYDGLMNNDKTGAVKRVRYMKQLSGNLKQGFKFKGAGGAVQALSLTTTGERAWNDPGSVDDRFRGLIQRHGLTNEIRLAALGLAMAKAPDDIIAGAVGATACAASGVGAGVAPICGAGAGTLWSNSVGGMLDRYTSDQFFRHVYRGDQQDKQMFRNYEVMRNNLEARQRKRKAHHQLNKLPQHLPPI